MGYVHTTSSTIKLIAYGGDDGSLSTSYIGALIILEKRTNEVFLTGDVTHSASHLIPRVEGKYDVT